MVGVSVIDCPPGPRLAQVVGQDGVVRLLQRLLARNRLPASILLEGQPGCGRRTLSTAVAAALLCAAPIQGDACGKCHSCQLVAAGNHPDVMSLPHDSEEESGDAEQVEAARSQLNAEAVRELVEVRVWESPLIGQRRVFLLPAVERLQRGQGTMANALLKALEEPPSRVHFLLTASASAGLMATIRSRTQCFRLQPLSVPDVERVLAAGGVAAGDAARRAALSTGSHRGLWATATETPPIESLRSLVDHGLESAALAEVLQQLPSREGGPAESRRVLRRWLLATQQAYRRDLPGPDGMTAAQAIDRIGAALRDLHLNIAPRLVLEGLAVGVG